jgi:hypothetical protein
MGRATHSPAAPSVNHTLFLYGGDQPSAKMAQHLTQCRPTNVHAVPPSYLASALPDLFACDAKGLRIWHLLCTNRGEAFCGIACSEISTSRGERQSSVAVEPSYPCVYLDAYRRDKVSSVTQSEAGPCCLCHLSTREQSYRQGGSLSRQGIKGSKSATINYAVAIS